MAHHLSVNLRDHRKSQRPGITQGLDDELFGLLTEWMIFEGRDGDGVYCVDIRWCFGSYDHFGFFILQAVFVVEYTGHYQ